MRRQKSDWLLISVGGLLGAFFGLMIGFYVMTDGLRTVKNLNPVQTDVSDPNPLQPGSGAQLQVEPFGRWHYKRTAPDPKDFDAEVITLKTMPGVIIMGLGFALGVQAGAMAGRWARARRRVVS